MTDSYYEADQGLYEKAVTLIREENRVSVSLVQRHLRIGYSRAARFIEKMEQDGIVSPYRVGGTRDVLPTTAKGERDGCE